MIGDVVNDALDWYIIRQVGLSGVQYLFACTAAGAVMYYGVGWFFYSSTFII